MKNGKTLQLKNNTCYYKDKKDSAIGNTRSYLSDEALESLIAGVEREPLLHPPRDFKSDIMEQLYRKKKRLKNRQLFSYSAKVILATAAALSILVMVPENIRPEDDRDTVWVKEWQDSGKTGRTPWDDPEADSYDRGFGYHLNKQMSEYCNRINAGLDRLVRMEVHDYEKEEE